MIGWNAMELRNWDPAAYASGHQTSLFRCCLLRRLYSYDGHPGDEGGAEVRPDLAIGMPEVSADGLTWTIRMREGLRYAPPYEDREIVARDVVEALERQAALTRRAADHPDVVVPDLGWGLYFSPIVGYDEMSEGLAPTISGLETPDDQTLVVHLETPTGDLADRLATSAAAPLPPGAADGRDDDYYRFLVASGPYMLEGADEAESGEALQPRRHPGWRPFTVLVRNPSWDPATDPLRAAYPARIEFSLLPPTQDTREVHEQYERIAAELEAGTTDVVPNPPASLVRAVEGGELAGRIVTERSNEQLYHPLNLGVPPFDDVHVRRAVNLAVDRSALRVPWQRLVDAPLALSWHMVPASVQGYRIPDTWRPSWAEDTPDTGDPRAARSEMARSRYDADGDGRCDGEVCRVWTVRSEYDLAPTFVAMRRAFAEVGLTLEVERATVGRWWRLVSEPAGGLPLWVDAQWASDYPNASTTFLPLFFGGSLAASNNTAFSLLGASPSQLEAWGYDVADVPSIDARIERCQTMSATDASACWTDLDVYLMEEVVPAIPVGTWDQTRLLSDRVVAYSFDQSTNLPAYDRIALAPEGGG
jgi:peptide/nickel transport system substrate-binding protein